jgi:hypothetical protein
VLRSSDAGVTWSVVLRDAPCQLWNIAGTPDGRSIYAAGNCGTVAWSEDHGSTWSSTGAAWRATSDRRTVPVRGVYLSSAGRRYFALDYEVCASVYVVDNLESRGGCEPLPWREYDGGGRSVGSPLGVWGAGDDDVWVYGVGSMLWRRR